MTPQHLDPEPDPWITRARPTFLYVMYTLLLGAIPAGLIAAVRPQMAQAIAAGMSAYLNAIPEPLYALFGTVIRSHATTLAHEENGRQSAPQTCNPGTPKPVHVRNKTQIISALPVGRVLASL